KRDVAHETNAHRLVEPFQEALPPLALGDGAVSLDRGMRVLPIPLGAYAVLVRHEDVTGKKLRHADERCPRPGDESEGEIRVDRREVELRPDEPGGEEALQLGGEDEQIASLSVVQRLDPETVAGDNRPALALVPDGGGEHPPQRTGEELASAAVQMRNDLGVAPRREDGAGSLQLPAKLRMVVELAVLHPPNETGIVG